MINPVSSLFKQLDLFLSELINGNPQPNEEPVKPIREKAKDQQKPSTPKKPSLQTESLMVTLEDQLVPYELQRNPRRKYLTIEISLDGNLIVRAPQTVTVEYVEQVLKTKSKWILDRLFVISNKRHSKPSDESNWDTIRDDAILIDNDWVPIIYEKGIRRRSVSMVIRNNTIIVRIPVRQNIKEVKNWVLKQRKWIEKHYRSQKQASEERIDIREKFFKDQKISLFGKEYEIIKKTGIGRDSIKDQQITLFFDHVEINDSKVFEGKLIALLKKYARPALETRFVSISSQLPLIGRKCQKMRLSSAKTRWGSCSSRGVISLNWRLILLDEEITKYVICHELAHLAQMNHSKNFWLLVEKYYPGYKEVQKRLKEVSLKDFPLD